MRSQRLFMALSVVTLLLGLLLDLITPPGVVMGIVLTIPVALSSFAVSRRFTGSMIGAALLANVLAGGVNALVAGTLSELALANRALSMLSVALVGVLTLRLREASVRAERLAARERQAREERAARAELERRNAVIRDLIYAFSHDLRTPLMANLVLMRLARQGAYGELSAAFQSALEHGVSANQDLLELADKLLMVARLESGELRPDSAALDLREVLLRRAGELGPALKARGVRLALDAPQPVSVRGDAAELRRAVQNLLDNAAKFSPPGGLVEVRLAVDPARALAQLQVIDAGPGVPPELAGRLFQRFRGSGPGAGSGLGLYLAHSIVAAHGGTLTYRRTAEQRSVFEIGLPLAGG